MRRFFCPVLPQKHQPLVSVDQDVSHHVLRVVGIAPGERVELFDGQGEGCIASLAKVEAGIAFFHFEEVAVVRNVAHELWLLVGLLRQQAFSNVIRMSCEIGVSKLLPIVCERSVARGNKQQRWQKIADAATGQSGRTKKMQVCSLRSFQEGLQSVAQGFYKVVLQPGSKPLRANSFPGALLIGPEGGLSPNEIQMAVELQWNVAGLGPLTLKADTAAIVAAGLMLRGC